MVERDEMEGNQGVRWSMGRMRDEIGEGDIEEKGEREGEKEGEAGGVEREGALGYP